MNEVARKFLAELDLAYLRGNGDGADWEDYCLECSVPGSRRRPIWRNDRWIMGSDFHPTKKITQLLEARGIRLEDFLAAWVRVTGLGISSADGGPLEPWSRGHMPSGCPKRSTIVKVLENFSETTR